MAIVQSVKTGKPDFPEIRKYYEDNLHPDKIDFNDQKVYENVFHKGRWAGIFQATQKPTQNFFVQCKPTSVVDLAAITSIWRPGPLAGKMHELYVDAKFNKPYDWGHPLLNETLADTYGLLIFQEQIMLLANKVAGYDLDQCDQIRRAILKRSLASGEAAKKEAAELRESFIAGCVKNGVPSSTANKLYDNILAWGGYGFNKSLCGADTVIVNNMEKQLKDVLPGDTVLTRDEASGENVFTTVQAVHDHGTLELVELELDSGEKVKCTMDHKFRVQETGEMLPLWLIHKKNLSIVVNDVVKASKQKPG